ncbi:hypothetical protein [Herbidospora yilanensis]|uniref:hypothetical protein n=1 Tax=Herbidospora yilanensis TaxID=354426 RepID=UPI0012F9BD96|nr:hypothetical protein [Herbidospora yilanensis]
MSEVVPLPSFGEVFFDARGQDRVLRVTWHEGTLVLSLWRGEMCTASFRMPMDDVGRLLETLQIGYAEATGQPTAGPDQPGTGPFPAPDLGDYPGEYPGTGQYSRPPAPEQQPMAPQQPFPPFPQEQQPMPVGYDPGPYPEATPAYGQPAPAAPAALGPNDVLVARGAPARDRLVAVDQQAPPRERPRRQAPQPDFPPFEGQVPAEPVYQFPSPIPGRPAYQFDPEPDAEAAQHQQQHFPADVYQADAPVYQTGSYQPQQIPQPPMPPQMPQQQMPQQQMPQQQMPQQQMPQQQMPQQQMPQQAYQQFPPEQRPHLVQAAPPFPPEPFAQGDPQAYPQGYAQGAVYSTDPSFQVPPGQQQYPPQQYADPRYQQQPPPQQGVDPNDPLGLGPVSRPYVEGQQPPMYSTGERVRPEGADERRDWS